MKNEKTKNILLGVLLVAVLTLTVAYASLSANLYVRSTGKVEGASTNWKVEFTEVSCTASGYAAVTHTLDLNATELSGLIATFKAPGDSVECTFNVENKGQIAAKLQAFTAQGGTLTYTGTGTTKTADEQLVNGKIVYSLVYGSTDAKAGQAPAANDALAVGQSRPLKLTMTYPSTETSMPQNDVTVSGFESTFLYVQD